MYICPHVHCRDAEESYKDTIEHVLHLAEIAGFTAIFDMPNTQPAVITRAVAVDRLLRALDARSPVQYFTYMGVTPDQDQVKEAVAAKHAINRIAGLKMVAGHTTGAINMTNPDHQYAFYQTATREGYHGIVAVHCEKDSLIRYKPSDNGTKAQDWNPQRPITHALARPPEAEVEAVKDQIYFACSAGFTGTLHIAHVSVPEAVRLINTANAALQTEQEKTNAPRRLRITCGVTLHHILLDYTSMERQQPHKGLYLKMNPPLRQPGYNTELLTLLRDGKIDWIETDHAPHTLDEKLHPPYASGITGLEHYQKFINYLRKKEFTEERICDITFNNIERAFGLSIVPRNCNPFLHIDDEYPFDSYEGLDAFR